MRAINEDDVKRLIRSEKRNWVLTQFHGVTEALNHVEGGLVGIRTVESPMPRWISVEERLPENYISVIGYLPIDGKEGLPPTREVYRTEKGWFAPSLGELCIVSHWMSMPEGFMEV